MRSVCVILLLSAAACGAPKQEAQPAPPAAPPAPTLATFAGSWETTALVGGKDTVKSTMTGTADSTGWSISLPGRPNVHATPSISGDSLVVQTAEYESVLRKGVKVSVRTASVMQGGMLVGNMEATYKTAKGVEVVKGTTMSMKAAPK